jgi:hypothetical protein
MIVYARRSLAAPGGGELGKPVFGFKTRNAFFWHSLAHSANFQVRPSAGGAKRP